MGLIERTKDTIRRSVPANTARAYQSDWAAFEAWCTRKALVALPAAPEVVAMYVQHLADPKDKDDGRQMKLSSIRRHVSSVSVRHQAEGFETPTRRKVVQDVLKGLEAVLPAAQTRRSAAPAATRDVVQLMVSSLPVDIGGLRDRAVILMGYAGAFRRSELVALDLEDLTWEQTHVIATVRHGKTGARRVCIKRGCNGAATCPVRTLRAWIDASGITSGPLFRSLRYRKAGDQVLEQRLCDGSVSSIIKDAAAAAGLDNAETYAGHSMRRGWVTTAIRSQAEERNIMRHTGHESVVTMRRYNDDVQLVDNPALVQAGL